MTKIKIKSFANKEDQFKWLIDNLTALNAQRRSEPKKADAFTFVSYAIDERGERLKADNTEVENQTTEDTGAIKVRCIINTTNLFDSHCDVHLPGIWKKSIQELKQMFLCYEHTLTYKGILSDEITPYTKKFTWKELGFDFEGDTEALVFDVILKKDFIYEENRFMYDRYKAGKVYNHSVRMQYIKEYFCMNSTDPNATQYKDNWDKYRPMVANGDDVDARGWFYAVTEAKIIEGSAVVRGSNCATPTLEVEDCEDKSQAEDNSLEGKQKEEPLIESTPKSYYSSLI